MNVLAIDTSNQVLALAIMQGEELVAALTTNTNNDHSSRLMPAITELLEKAKMDVADLGAIVVAAGPGSYTGTRIGVTTAKTLAWALKIPIIPVSSLEVLGMNGALFDGLICPFFDARRRTVFTGLYQFSKGKLKVVKPEQNQLMDNWLEELQVLGEQVLFLSPHMDVYQEQIMEKLGALAVIPEAAFHMPNAAQAISLSRQYEAVDAHLVAPNYLRITEAEANWLKRQEGVVGNG